MDTRAVLQAQVSAEPSTQSQLLASLLSPSTAPSAAFMVFQHSLAALPASPWVGCMLSPCLPPSAHPQKQQSLVYIMGLEFQVLLPPFSPT